MNGLGIAYRGVLWVLFALLLVPKVGLAQGFDTGKAGMSPIGASGVEALLDDVSGGEVSLKAAIQSAMDDNPEFLSGKHAAAVSHEAYLQSYGALLPQLDFVARGGYALRHNDTTEAMYSGGDGDAWTNEERVVLSQLLFDGGLTSSKVAADKLHSESRREELFNTAEDVGLSATQYFMEVIRTRAVVELCLRNIAEHEKLAELTRIRQEGGGGTQADVTQAQAALEEARSRLVQATQAAEDAEAGYVRFFGAKPGALAMPDRPAHVVPQSEDAAVSQAAAGNRALKAARLAEQQKEREIDSAKGRMMPKVQVKLSAGRADNTGGYTADYYDASAMLELSFNLFSGGSDAAAIRKAKADRLKAEQDALGVQREVEEDMRTAWSFYRATGRLLSVLRSLTDENAQVVTSYTDQFRMGQRSLVDLVSAQKSLFSSQQVYLNGMAAHTFSHYRLCAPASRLMETLGVDLRVEEIAD